MIAREYNFDGIVGPTHNYGGLSLGNVASARSSGRASNPRAAALQGIEKMRFVHRLGVGQAVLPPPARPDLPTLRRLGFAGADEAVLAKVASEHEHLLRWCASSSAMWAANAATVAPSCDTRDGRVHLVPANLVTMFHRAIEADATTATLRAIFADPRSFAVHDPLPAHARFADEGAANHTRLVTDGHAAVHLFGWGRTARDDAAGPERFPARQTLEASEAVARLLAIDPARALLFRQDPSGIDAGAFHTDVLAVGTGSFLMLHELAFSDVGALMQALAALLGSELCIALATDDELPVADAVAAYPFNSQVLRVGSGKLVIVAPEDSRDNPRAHALLERIVAEDNPVEAVHYLDVRESMDNGGGPACLRLRVPLRDDEARALSGNVLFSERLGDELGAWVSRHYRDRLLPEDLADPALWREVMTALDELTRILALPKLYAFQS